MEKEQRADKLIIDWREELFKRRINYDSPKVINEIYYDLIYRGVPHEEQKVDISVDASINHPDYSKGSNINSPYATPGSAFNNWINYYADKENTDVFIDEQMRSFCQFASKDGKANKQKYHMVVYIPLDREHIEDGARLIFDYLDQNAISHKSKVSKRIRNDNIAVKLINPEDVDKLVDFVKNNKYLQEGLLPPNPFAFNLDGLALTVEGNVPYNRAVSEILGHFMEDYSAAWEIMGYEHFGYYLTRLYRAYFENDDPKNKDYEKMQNILYQKVKEIKKSHKGKMSDEEKMSLLANYQQVFKLLINSRFKDFDFDSFVRHYASTGSLPTISDKEKNETDEMLIHAITTMTQNLGIQSGLDSVRNFYNNGEDREIAKNKPLHKMLVKSYFRTNLKLVLNSSQMDFDSYVNKVLEEYQVTLVEEMNQRSK